MNRRFLADAVGIATIFTKAAALDRPNVIIFLCDDLGPGDIGRYGQKIIPTPNLDRLATQGMTFTDAYSSGTVCTPSRCSLMLGLSTGHGPIRMNIDRDLRPSDITIAEVLHGAGYRTAVIGKWSLGSPNGTGHPSLKGYDYFVGYLSTLIAQNYYPEWLWKNHGKLPLKGNHDIKFNVPDKRGTNSNDVILSESEKWIAAKSKKPFFLYLPITYPHPNNSLPVGEKLDVPIDPQFADKPWGGPTKRYASMVTRIDGYVGRVMQVLQKNHLADNTLLIFTSDNGPHDIDGGHLKFFNSTASFRGMKRDLYEGGIRMPFIVRWPGHVRADSVSHLPVVFYDVFSTLAELTHSKTNRKTDGVSFSRELLNGPNAKGQKKNRPMYWEFFEAGRWQQAVRFGRYKVIRPNTKATIEVYDLQADPGESRNLAHSRPDLVKKGLAYFKTLRTKPSKDISPY